MVQRGQNLGFALEPGEALRVLSQLARKHLDRYFAVELRILGAVHFAHSARADRRKDLEGAESIARPQRHSV
jgi:hypothetical protein